MPRLTRAQQQQRTRAVVLTAAREEYAAHGYGGAKVDRIAERAELTRGAVYSNFPSKRALYLAVLVDMVERAATAARPPASPVSPAAALEVFARVWLERLPLTDDTPARGHLQLRSLTGVLDDGAARTALAQIVGLEALLFGLALEALRPPRTAPVRRVRLAELVLTLLHGAGGLAEVAPGFGDPFAMAHACRHLAGIDLPDVWDPPHLPYVAPARPDGAAWDPAVEVRDQLTGYRVDPAVDGVIAVLGAGRLTAAEEAVRATPAGEQVTIVVVTGAPAEIGRLVRLRVGDVAGCLRRVFAAGVWPPPLRLVVDGGAAVASALGLPTVDDTTEAAARIRDGAIVARAEGRGAAHAAATADVSGDAARGGDR